MLCRYAFVVPSFSRNLLEGPGTNAFGSGLAIVLVL